MRAMAGIGLAVLLAGLATAGVRAGEIPAAAKARAEEIAKASGVRAGLCVHLGVSDGDLTAALADRGKLLVHGLAADDAAVAKARAAIEALGAYGQASVARSDFKKLPYAENLVNLLLAEDLPGLLAGGMSLEEAARVLAPRGALCFKGNVDAAKLKAAGFADAKSAGGWTVARKPWPAEMDEWPSYRHGPDGNKVSQDTLVGPPARLRWVVGPVQSRRHGMSLLRGMVSAGGRLFCVADESPTNVAGPARAALVARDAHNGLLLWRRPIIMVHESGAQKGQPWRFPTEVLAASRDRVYAVLEPGGPLVALDAASGETVMTCKEVASPAQVVIHGDLLILAGGRSVAAVETAGGKPRWVSSSGGANPVVAGDKLFLGGDTVTCLSLADGRQEWKQNITVWAKGRSALLFGRDGRLFLGASLGYGKDALVHAVSAKDGAKLWSRQYGPLHSSADVSFAQGLVWINCGKTEQSATGESLGLDPASGEISKRIVLPKYFHERGHSRCYPNTATEKFLLHGSRGTDFIEMAAGKVHDMRVFCGDCGFGLVPANGLLYMAPNSCTCAPYLGGFRALAAAGDGEGAGAAARAAPLVEKGPAFGAAAGAKAAPDDWPTLRRNGWRSGSTAAAVPAELRPLWSAELGGAPSAPTVAAGAVYVALPERHRVAALGAADGKPLWSFTAGGAVDSPPTIHEGLALFGGRDGWVYALGAADGRLAWRLRAAPGERLIVSGGRLESAWPVPGSVLIRDGRAYFAAGRAPELDGGVTVFSIEPGTAKVVWAEKSPTLADVMVVGGTGGRAVCMKTWEFDPTGGKSRPKTTHNFLQVGAGMVEPQWSARKLWSNGADDGQLLVFDPATRRTYTFRSLHAGKDSMAKPGQGECRIYCTDPSAKGAAPVWSVKLPLAVRAMALTKDALFVAGTPDAAKEGDYWAAFDGREGGLLLALSTKDGSTLSEMKLPAAPVFDGLAAAGGRLYLSTEDGKLGCFGGK